MRTSLGTRPEDGAVETCVDCGRSKKLKARGRCKACYEVFRILYADKVRHWKKTPEYLTQEQNDVLLGLMLGDGSLCEYRESTRTAYLRVNRSSKDSDYARSQLTTFKDFVAHDDVRQFSRFLHGKEYFSCSFFTARATVFGEWYERWYMTGKKQVPLDLGTISDRALAVWWCDDGCIINRNLKLATHGFDEASIDHLVTILNDRFDGGFAKRKQTTGWSINGNREATKAFITCTEEYVRSMLPRKLKP